MIELDKPFKLDKNGLWYINSNNVNLTSFKFPEIGKSYEEKPQFFKIDGINDYIVKDTTMYPFFFNGKRTISILKKLQEKQQYFDDIDFPIGYLKGKDGIKGTIVPYYRKATSLRDFIYLKRLNDLESIYNHRIDEIDNLITLFLDILDLISKMYYQNMVYLDIHSGNFLFYKNNVKVIDFEVGYVYFTDNKTKYYERLIKNYTMLVEKICNRLGFKEILLYPGEGFMETEYKVKALRKELER